MRRYNPYIRNCLEVRPDEHNDVWCLFQHLVKAWQDPKYDVDIMLCFSHLAWAVGVWLSYRFPESFMSYTGDMTMRHGHSVFWVFAAFFLGVGHYFSIFLRRPLLRIPIFFLSMLWGVFVSFLMFSTFGGNLASLVYLVIFAYMPARKIAGIIRTSIQDFKEERFFAENEEYKALRSDDRGEAS